MATREIRLKRNMISNDGRCCLPFLHSHGWISGSPSTTLPIFLENLDRCLASGVLNGFACRFKKFHGLVFNSKHNKLEKSCWEVLLYVVSWSIWIARNDLVFNNLDLDSSSLIDLIKCRCAYMKCLKEIRRLRITKNWGGVVVCAAVGGEFNYNGDGILGTCVFLFLGGLFFPFSLVVWS